MTPVGMLVELEHVGKGVTDVVIESGGLSKGMGPPLQAAFHNLVRLEAHITASNGLQELLGERGHRPRREHTVRAYVRYAGCIVRCKVT